MTREGLVCDAEIGVCLPHSDHKVVEFKIFGDRRKNAIKTTALDMSRVL